MDGLKLVFPVVGELMCLVDQHHIVDAVSSGLCFGFGSGGDRLGCAFRSSRRALTAAGKNDRRHQAQTKQ